MNDREALLTGLVLGALRSLVEREDTPFTYDSVRQASPMVDEHGNFENRIIVTAADGAVFMVTVEQT